MAPYTQQSRSKRRMRAIELYDMYAVKYRTNISVYQELLETKRQLGLYPLRTIPKRVLKDYPKIPYFDFESRAEAIGYLDGLTDAQLDHLIEKIEFQLKCNCTYNTVTAKIYEYRYQIRHRNDKKSKFGCDPGSRRAKGRGKNGGVREE